MSNQQDFEDRFTYANPALAAVVISQQTEDQLSSLSPELVIVAEMVRSYSILTRRKTLLEVYNTVTQHSDPRIALILAAARDKNDGALYPNLSAVKAAMYGPSSETGTEFLDSERNIFVDGIRRVTAALAASQLINQLAQIPEQHEHAKHLEKQALDDLDRIIKVSDSTVSSSSRDLSNDESTTFFFENLNMTLNTTLQAEIYMPSVGATAIGSGASWNVVGTYTGIVQTASIVADIADKINELTLVTGTANILASPVLAADAQTHQINVSARSRNPDVNYEVIILKFTNLSSASLVLPFRWGVTSTRLERLPINSALISVAQGRVSSLSALEASSSKREPTVLYFKRAPLSTTDEPLDYQGSIIPPAEWQSSNLVFRVSPTQNENVTISFPRLLNTDSVEQLKLDNLRYSQLALLLLNELFAVKGGTRALGALVRNDDPTATDPLAALELVAFSVTNPETWMVLDVLEIPADLLMATGNLQGPITQFSNKPRSIRIQSTYDYRFEGGTVSNTNLSRVSGPSVLQRPKSDILTKINDQYKLFTGEG